MKMSKWLVVALITMALPLMAEERGGIGLIIVNQKTNQPLRVGNVFKGSPAAKAGIEPGSYLISADGTNLVGLSVTQAMHLVSGRVGAPVVLELADPKMSRTNKVALTRAKLDWLKSENLVVPEVHR